MSSMARTMSRKMGREQNRELRNMISTMRVERTIKEVDEARAATEKLRAQTVIETNLARSAARVALGSAVGVLLLSFVCLAVFIVGVL